MNSEIVNKYRIKLGLIVSFVITLFTFGVLWQNISLKALFLIATARFLYVFAIWMLYFPISNRFKHKLKALFVYLLVCIIVILPLIDYNLWVNDITNLFYPSFEDPALIKNKVEFFRFYYIWRAIAMGLL